MKIGYLAVLFLVLSIIPGGCSQNGKDIPEVDLSKRAPILRNNGLLNETPPFRMAIGAMISPKETLSVYGELTAYLGKKLGRKVEVIQRKTYSEINEMVEKEEVDSAFVCSGPYVEGHGKFGMEIVAVPLVRGKPLYYAYIITRKGRSLKTMNHLRGKSFAFTDPSSNTGAIVPRYLLSRMGETPESFFSKVIYTYSHDNSIKAVSDGIVDGASVDSLIYDYYRANNPRFVAKTQIIYRSPPYGIPPVVVHPEAPPVLKMKLREILLHMHEEPEGKEVLKKINIDRFVVPDDSIYDSVREMQRWLKDKR